MHDQQSHETVQRGLFEKFRVVKVTGILLLRQLVVAPRIWDIILVAFDGSSGFLIVGVIVTLELFIGTRELTWCAL